jgi:beta-lactamase class A
MGPADARGRRIFGATLADPRRADFTAAFREDLRLSIYRSDNAAATRALESVGHAYVAAFLWGAGLYDPREGGGLWVGRGFGRDHGPWRPEPLRGLLHAATPLALTRFYALLAQGRLVDAPSSDEMRGLLGDSAFFNRFRAAVLGRYPGARVYRKTGTVFPWRHDSALVERPGARYVVVGLCRGDDCSQRLVALGEALDDCVAR